MSALAAKHPVDVPSERPKVAAVFNLDDANERRIQNAIQIFYTDCDRLHAIRRGTAKGMRMVWTLGSFHPDRPNARVEWSVLHWAVDEISVRVQRCPEEAAARAAFPAAGSRPGNGPFLQVADRRTRGRPVCVRPPAGTCR